jgi:hypothetical protein
VLGRLVDASGSFVSAFVGCAVLALVAVAGGCLLPDRPGRTD